MSWRHPTEADWDHARDLRKHDTDPLPHRTNEEIRAELDRIEAELVEAATKSQAACKEAMNVIERLMADLGAPMSKAVADV